MLRIGKTSRIGCVGSRGGKLSEQRRSWDHDPLGSLTNEIASPFTLNVPAPRCLLRPHACRPLSSFSFAGDDVAITPFCRTLRQLAEEHTKPALDGTVRLIMQQGVEAIRHGKTTTGNKVGAAALKPFERTCDARNRIKQWQTPAEVFATEQKRKRRQR